MAEEKIILGVEIDTSKSQANVDNLALSIDELRESNRKLQKTIKDARKDLDKTDDQLKKEGKSRNQLNGIIKNNSIIIARNRDEISRTRKERNKAIRSITGEKTAFQKLSKSIRNTAVAFLGFRTAFNVLKTGLKTIASFEEGMSKVRAVTGALPKDFNQLKNNALRLGASTSKTAKEISELQLEFAKLGFSTKEILDATEATIQLSIAAGSDLANSATVAASTIRGFGLDASETQRVVDVMAKSFSSSALDMEKFKVAMASVAPVAKANGKDIEFTTSRLSILSDAGLDASTAGTSLRNMFLELSKKGLTFDQGLEKINKSTDKARTALDLFGKRGATAALILAENIEKADELEESYRNATGAAEEMAKIMEDNLIGDTKKLSSAWEGFILGLNKGEGTISNVFRTLTQAITKAIQKLNDLNKSINQLASDRAKQAFESTKKFIERQEEQFQIPRLEELIKSNEKSLLSIQKELDKQGVDVFFSKRTLKRLETQKQETLELLRLYEAYRIELTEVSKETEDITTKTEDQDEAIKKLNFNLKEQIKLTEKLEKIEKEIEKEFDDRSELDSELDRELEHAEALLTINEERLRKEIEQKAKAAESEEEINRQIRNAAISAASITANSIFQIRSNQIEAEKNAAINAEGVTEKEKLKIQKDAAKEQKKISRKQAFINGALAVIRAFADLGPIAGAISAVLIGIETAAQIAVINSQTFARGGQIKMDSGGSIRSGVFSGPSHAGGGIGMTLDNGQRIETEGDEGLYVVNKRDNPAAIAMLSAINSMHGRAFSTPVSFAQDGGEVAANAQIQQNRQIEEAISKLVIVTKVTDINNVQADRQTTVNNAIINA
jgi:hypothetical protein